MSAASGESEKPMAFAVGQRWRYDGADWTVLAVEEDHYFPAKMVADNGKPDRWKWNPDYFTYLGGPAVPQEAPDPACAHGLSKCFPCGACPPPAAKRKAPASTDGFVITGIDWGAGVAVHREVSHNGRDWTDYDRLIDSDPFANYRHRRENGIVIAVAEATTAKRPAWGVGVSECIWTDQLAQGAASMTKCRRPPANPSTSLCEDHIAVAMRINRWTTDPPTPGTAGTRR